MEEAEENDPEHRSNRNKGAEQGSTWGSRTTGSGKVVEAKTSKKPRTQTKQRQRSRGKKRTESLAPSKGMTFTAN